MNNMVGLEMDQLAKIKVIGVVVDVMPSIE